jgi:hypothetical protein
MTIPGRCHIDADGWLRGPIAITHYYSPNHYPSGFTDKARGMVQHTEDGFTAGTVETFMNAATQVSAFFGAGEDGSAQQFLPLGRGLVAWAEDGGNPYWRSCECEDKTKTGQPMTAPQLAAFAQILEACSAYDGFPLVITDDVDGTGLITHGDGGVPWGDHPDCPGDVRKAQRPEIIALAKAIRAGTPPKPPGGTVTEHVTAGSMSLAELAAQHGTAPATILRETADRTPAGYDQNVADYINGVFHGTIPVTQPMPSGLHLWGPFLPA